MLVKMSTKGQLVIPQEIRKVLNLQPGAELEIELDDKKIVLTPLVERQSFETVLDSLYGSLAGEPLLDMLEEEHRWEIARDEERIARLMGHTGDFDIELLHRHNS
jgi:AbrB family looped-hinge helix DNA binding protein